MTSLFASEHFDNVDNVDNNMPCDCDGCMGDSIESGPAEWAEWTDEDVWNIPEGVPSDDERDYRRWSASSSAREHLDHGDRLTLDELVERQVEFFESWGNSGGDFLAEELRALAFKIRMTSVITADEYRARVDRLDDDARESWQSAGYLDGLAAGRSLANPVGTFGHPA